MVKHCRVLIFSIFFIAVVPIVASALTTSVSAQTVQYQVEKEWVKIWINPDGTIDLQYDLRVLCDQGSFSYIFFDQPVGDFKLGEAVDASGHALRFEDATQGSDYKVKVYLDQPVTAGQAAEFFATTNVGHMISEDQTNSGNVGMQFTPTTWPTASGSIGNLRILIITPSGVTKEQVKATPDWDNAFNDPNENGRLVVYWERQNLAPTTRFQTGLSFPQNFVQHYETLTTAVQPAQGFTSPIPMAALSVVIFAVVVGAVSMYARPRNYVNPKIQMETLGIRRGLTAVEAAYLLEIIPVRIIVMILYGLLLKRAVWVNSTKPSLTIQVSEEFKQPATSPDIVVRYYEEDFIHAIKTDQTLDERGLAEAYMHVRSAVESKMRGYCRADTIAFYRKTVQEAWETVQKSGTPELASQMFDQNLLWLMTDPEFKLKTESTFNAIPFIPQPVWWWYWYGDASYNPNPTYNPVSGRGQPPPKIPGAEFANLVATSFEQSANNIVVSLEKFTNSILPVPPPSQNVSSTPVHHDANCACACVSCACVCACVSCACACASGGGVG
jgi:hypothetical protein